MGTLNVPPVVGGKMPRWIYSLIVVGMIGLSLVLFLGSLVTNCFYTSARAGGEGQIGFMLLLVGWAALFDGMVAWFANPILFFAWLSLAVRPMRWLVVPSAGMAFLVALTFLLHWTILRDESGGRADILRLGVGYYLWLLSMVMAGVGGVVVLFLRPEGFGSLFGKR